ncbi:MAG: 16S rRNA (uracil(1498)-N(3))-methyltransferase [Clostridia bacterium]|nr:16S rRNA (uracil(1498)-N(3))-methyltransferase [Clostridia bacterium]
MANFYINKDAIKETTATITGDEAKHISKVLRMKKGDSVVLCDGEGHFYDAVLSSFTETSVTADILSSRDAETEPKVKITIYQGVPKNPKLETIVQKATEVGVCAIVPVDTVRAVAKIDKEAKIERLRKIAAEAAKQSKRGIIPEVKSVMTFKKAAEEAKNADIALIPYEEETEVSLKEALRGKKAETIAIMIGPEGGFEKSEVEYAKSLGIQSVTLGKRILRTETAGLCVSTAVLYEMDEMR